MANQFLGELRMFAGNFSPQGWALASGQLLSISQNTALFALLGTTYGGNGTTTFALPNLQSRIPMHMGSAVGLTSRVLGQVGGAEIGAFSSQQIPSSPATPIQAYVPPTFVSSESPFLALTFIIALQGIFPSRN